MYVIKITKVITQFSFIKMSVSSIPVPQFLNFAPQRQAKDNLYCQECSLIHMCVLVICFDTLCFTFNSISWRLFVLLHKELLYSLSSCIVFYHIIIYSSSSCYGIFMLFQMCCYTENPGNHILTFKLFCICVSSLLDLLFHFLNRNVINMS